MRLLTALLFIASVSSAIAVTGSKTDLSGTWSFALDPLRIGEQKNWHQFPANWGKTDALATDSWDQVNGWDLAEIPHCWTVDPRYREYTGYAWYRRAFQIPPQKDPRTVYRLNIESIGDRGDIWVNGQYIGKTLIAGIKTAFDITRALRPGQSNLITTRADNRWDFDTIPGARNDSASDKPRDQLYPWPNFGGILGSIFIEALPALHIENQQILATPNPDGTATVAVRADLSQKPAAGTPAKINLVITDAASGKVLLKTETTASDQNPRISATLKNPRLWSPESPQLYQATLTIAADGATHSRTDQFGVRDIRTSGAQLLLNGKPIRYAGANRARGHPATGGIDTDEIAENDVRLLKDAGLILARLQHTPPSAALLEHADKNGLLIIAEIPVWGFSATDLANPVRIQLARESLAQMIRTTWNHPSIIGWSVGNEYYSWTPESVAWTKNLVALCRELDPSRLTTFAALDRAATFARKGEREAHSYHHVDFISQNLYSSPARCTRTLDLLHKRWPDRPILITEFGKRVDRVESEDERIRHFDEMLQIVRDRPWIVGLSYWTINDYRSTYPATRNDGIRPWGIVDEQRKPRPLYHHIQKVLKETPLNTDNK